MPQQQRQQQTDVQRWTTTILSRARTSDHIKAALKFHGEHNTKATTAADRQRYCNCNNLGKTVPDKSGHRGNHHKQCMSRLRDIFVDDMRKHQDLVHDAAAAAIGILEKQQNRFTFKKTVAAPSTQQLAQQRPTQATLQEDKLEAFPCVFGDDDGGDCGHAVTPHRVLLPAAAAAHSSANKATPVSGRRQNNNDDNDQLATAAAPKRRWRDGDLIRSDLTTLLRRRCTSFDTTPYSHTLQQAAESSSVQTVLDDDSNEQQLHEQDHLDALQQQRNTRTRVTRESCISINNMAHGDDLSAILEHRLSADSPCIDRSQVFFIDSVGKSLLSGGDPSLCHADGRAAQSVLRFPSDQDARHLPPSCEQQSFHRCVAGHSHRYRQLQHHGARRGKLAGNKQASNSSSQAVSGQHIPQLEPRAAGRDHRLLHQSAGNELRPGSRRSHD